MPDTKIVCDNCGSSFVLSYENEEVSYNPSHCPFCGDFFDSESDELNFNDEESSYYDNEEQMDLFEDDEDKEDKED